MKAHEQVPYAEPKDLSYSWSAQHERETGERPGGGERKEPVMEDLQNHIMSFVFILKAMGCR